MHSSKAITMDNITKVAGGKVGKFEDSLPERLQEANGFNNKL